MSKKMLLMFTAVLAMVALLSGCTKKPKIDLSELRNSQNGASANGGSGFESDPFVAGENDSADDLINGTGGSWGDLNEAVPGTASDFLVNAQSWNEIVYFAYNNSEVLSSERPKLDRLAQHLLSQPGNGVVIEAHCDERGSDEFNRALSERRALAVKDYLVTIGVADSSIQTISYGEDRPAVPNATTDEEHQLNRRAEFLVGTKK